MEYVQRGEPIIATSCVGEGRSVGEVDVMLGRVSQMLLHAAANMSMRSGGFNVADAVDIIAKARSAGPGGSVRRRRMVGKAYAITWRARLSCK